MQSNLDARPLPFPVSFFDLPRVASISDTTLAELTKMFGAPTGITDRGDPGPTERWAFSYPCGLQLVYELDLLHNQTHVIADIPEVEHVVRHLPFPDSRVDSISDEELQRQQGIALELLPHREAEFNSLRAAQVWRQGDDGNRILIGRRTTVRAAKCRVAELESHKHKQLYGYTLR